MKKSSNHQLLNSKISISRFPKFSISTVLKAQIHQIISKFKPNLQSTGNHTPPRYVPPLQQGLELRRELAAAAILFDGWPYQTLACVAHKKMAGGDKSCRNVSPYSHHPAFYSCQKFMQSNVIGNLLADAKRTAQQVVWSQEVWYGMGRRRILN